MGIANLNKIIAEWILYQPDPWRWLGGRAGVLGSPTNVTKGGGQGWNRSHANLTWGVGWGRRRVRWVPYQPDLRRARVGGAGVRQGWDRSTTDLAWEWGVLCEWE